jgi:hypothetical protein
MTCIYLKYQKYCERVWIKDNYQYGYADLTDYVCDRHNCSFYKNILTKEKENGKCNNLVSK